MLNETIRTIFISLFLLSSPYGNETGSTTQTVIPSLADKIVTQSGENHGTMLSREAASTDNISGSDPPSSDKPDLQTNGMGLTPVTDQPPPLPSTTPKDVNAVSAIPQDRSASQEQHREVSDTEKRNVGTVKNQYVYWGLGLLVVTGVIILVFLFSQKSPGDPRQADDVPVFQVAQKAASEERKKDTLFLPFHIFSGDWFRNVDPKKLNDFVEGTRNDAVAKFFNALPEKNVPKAEDLKKAQRDMGQLLNERIISIGAMEMINGAHVAQDEKTWLEQTLNTLLPAIKIPKPIVEGEVNAYVLAFLAAVGAFLGFSSVGSLGRWGMGIPPEAGMMFGAVLGAGGVILLAMFIVNNPKIRKGILLTIGSIAIADALLKFVKAQIPLPKFLRGQTGTLAFLKRLGWYVLVFITIFLVKHEKTFNQNQYRETIENFVEQWIRSVLPILAILIVWPEKVTGNTSMDRNERILLELFPLVVSLQNKSGGDREQTIKLLVAKFESKGYKIPGKSKDQEYGEIPGTMIWNDSLSEQYDDLDAPEPDEPVEIRKHPIIRNDKVLEKGTVARKID